MKSKEKIIEIDYKKRQEMTKHSFEIDREREIIVENNVDIYYYIKIPVIFDNGKKGIISGYAGMLDLNE